jgi:F-type H+-transporting ATPase subunit alpha
MAELTIRPEEVQAALASLVQEFKPRIEQEEVGRVTYSGDGIAIVSGLPRTMSNELLSFPGDLPGLALNLNEDTIGVVVLGDAEKLEEGMPVRQTGRVLSVQVGDAYLGRVVNALGRPIDAKGPLDSSKLAGLRPLEVQAPSVIQRQPVNQPLYTGIKAIDAMTPIGRGQRELIIGDRQSGKTAICIDTILNQGQYWGTDEAVYCVYVAIGQKASTVAEVVAALTDAGAMRYTTVVSSPASEPGALKYLAPYSGCAIAQYWMYNGKHALIVYDDLSKQADAYREIALLLRRPPGREAYPGDVFYLHSRLLERAARVSDDLGGGSLTALPVVETKEGDISAYIPTNVISITDGQIFLEKDLFNRGQRPAIDVGRSVSRVGGDAQIKAMKKAIGPLKLDLAQYSELQAFAMFASDLDKASQQQLARGDRLFELLKQPQFQPMPVERQIVSIYAGTRGYLDDIPTEDVRRFEQGLLDYVSARAPEVFDHFRTAGDFPDDIEAKLKAVLDDYKAGFRPGAPAPQAAANAAAAEAS